MEIYSISIFNGTLLRKIDYEQHLAKKVHEMNTLKSILLPCISEERIFDKFIQRFEDHCVTSHTISEFKTSKRLKGELFEVLCVELINGGWFRKISKNTVEVFRYSELTSEQRALLKLPAHSGDVGIDIVCKDQNGWIAVQCKYRKRPNPHSRYNTGWKVSWKELSTFYALCANSGPWSKCVIITNGLGIARQGRAKVQNEIAICKGSFESLPRECWLSLCGDNGHVLDIDNKTKVTQEDVRNIRMKWIMNM